MHQHDIRQLRDQHESTLRDVQEHAALERTLFSKETERLAAILNERGMQDSVNEAQHVQTLRNLQAACDSLMARARGTERRLQDQEMRDSVTNDRTETLERELRLSQERLRSEEITVTRLRGERNYAHEELQGCQNGCSSTT